MSGARPGSSTKQVRANQPGDGGHLGPGRRLRAAHDAQIPSEVPKGRPLDGGELAGCLRDGIDAVLVAGVHECDQPVDGRFTSRDLG